MEIKFRGKRIDDGELIESQSIINEHGQTYLKHPEQMGQWVRVVPETVCLATVDGNGTIDGLIKKLELLVGVYGEDGTKNIINQMFKDAPIESIEDLAENVSEELSYMADAAL